MAGGGTGAGGTNAGAGGGTGAGGTNAGAGGASSRDIVHVALGALVGLVALPCLPFETPV